MYVFVHLLIYWYVYMCVCMHVRMYVCVCMYVCMNACMYVWYVWMPTLATTVQLEIIAILIFFSYDFTKVCLSKDEETANATVVPRWFMGLINRYRAISFTYVKPFILFLIIRSTVSCITEQKKKTNISKAGYRRLHIFFHNNNFCFFHCGEFVQKKVAFLVSKRNVCAENMANL